MNVSAYDGCKLTLVTMTGGVQKTETCCLHDFTQLHWMVLERLFIYMKTVSTIIPLGSFYYSGILSLGVKQLGHCNQMPTILTVNNINKTVLSKICTVKSLPKSSISCTSCTYHSIVMASLAISEQLGVQILCQGANTIKHSCEFHDSRFSIT